MLKVKELASPNAAAIGGAEGGEIYGLIKIASGLANQPIIALRFLVVAREPIRVSPLVPAQNHVYYVNNTKNGFFGRNIIGIA